MMEEYGLVLDYLPQGKATDIRREPTAYALGEKFFTLLELVVKEGSSLKVGERIYLGREMEQRSVVERIKGRVNFDDLTSSAKSELKSAIRGVISSREQEFVDFFNKAGAITIRQHQLELLPGVGKKHLEEILSERDKRPFASLKDIGERIPHFQNPIDVFVERIIEELRGSRYYLFTRPPTQERGYR